MRAAAYARFSTEKQCSTEVQLQKITEYCLKNGHTIESIFIDEGKSGTNIHRDGFMNMEKAAQAKEFDCVVIYDITRGSRDVADWFNFRKRMSRLGLVVLSTQDNLGDISNPNDFLMELLSVGIGQHMVLSTRIKSKDAIVQRAKKGKFCGGLAPLGYNIVDGDYVINEHEANAVRKIFELYAAGSSYADIVDWLALKGYVGKRGKPLGKNSLNSILKNERYIGTYSWNKRIMKYMNQWAGGKPNPDAIVIEGIIPQIITESTWEKVRERMIDNKHNNMNKSRCKREYLLSGILKCKKCGGAMVGVTNRNQKGYEYKFYTCANKKRLRNCDCKNIAADEIETLIVSILKDNLLNKNMVEATADAILETFSSSNTESKETINEEIKSLSLKINNILSSIENGLDSDTARARLADLEARRKILLDQEANTKTRPIIDRATLIKQLNEDVTKLMDGQQNTKGLIKKYIVKVEIDNEEVVIYAVKDVQKTVKPLDSSNGLNTFGCGERI